MPSLLLYGIIAIGILGMLGGIGYKVRESGKDSVRLEWKEANEKARFDEQARSAKAAKELEDERNKKKIVYRTITQTVDKYIDRPVYRQQCFDDDGLRDARRAIAGEIGTGSKPDITVPATKPAI